MKKSIRAFQSQTRDILVERYLGGAAYRGTGAVASRTTRTTGRSGHGHDLQGTVGLRAIEEAKLRRALHHVLPTRAYVGSLHAEGGEFQILGRD